MKIDTMVRLGLLIVLTAVSQPAAAQTLDDLIRPLLKPPWRGPSFAWSLEAAVRPSFTKVSSGEWAERIDETWGPGLPAADQLQLFDTVIEMIDREYGAFHNLEIDVAALRDRYRPEVENGVSRGRFVAIMNHMSLALKDTHTFIVDRQVNWNTWPWQGVPLLWIGAWLDNSRFGASLTPLPDGTLLVIKARPDHRLGLEPGDIILGYDGVRWSELYPQLLEAELPLHMAWAWGSTDESMHHCMMMSAGHNWHLFETIDVVKFGSGEILHLDTRPLRRATGPIWGNEQLPVAGVPMPDLAAEDYVTWGVVDGTDIGYIYVASWHWDSRYGIRQKFRDAISQLMDHTVGLILDFRLNLGGGGGQSDDGLALLFDSEVYTMDCHLREVGSPDHLAMIPHPTLDAEYFKIRGDPATVYDRPIAVLIGPGTVSAGDVQSKRLSFHPRVRTFGKPSNGAFTVSKTEDSDLRWYASMATGTEYLLDTGRHLAHTGVPVDTEVWFSPADVAQGRDTVVEAALRWIRGHYPRRARIRIAPD